MMKANGIVIIGTAHYLPERVVTNEELCLHLSDKSITPEWIETKTGIKRRYIASKDESASFMAINVARQLLDKSKIRPDEIGLIIIASFSQDYLCPPMSAKIHSAIGASIDCQILDINTACVGLISGLTIASERMIFDEDIKYSIVIGVEILSPYTDSTDKATAVFFSDGASGVIISRTSREAGYLDSKFATDSSTYESVRMRGGGSTFPASRVFENKNTWYLEQNGLATWKQAITNQPYVISELLKNNKLNTEDIDFFVFHQANAFLIDYIMKKLRIPKNKTFINVEEIGNTGAASMGIALSDAFDRKLIKKNDLVILTGVGAGFNFGAGLWRI